MSNADLQTIGIYLQAIITVALAYFAAKGLSAWKAQSRASYRLDVLRNLSRNAFCVVARVHDARGRIHQSMRSDDVAHWTSDQIASTAPVMRVAAESILQSNDELLLTLVEARGAWGDDSSLQILGKNLAYQVRDIHGTFREFTLLLERYKSGSFVEDAEKRKVLVRACLGNGDQEPTPATLELMGRFNALLKQVEDEFRAIQK